MFYILKINTSYIINNKYIINLDFNTAKTNDFVISIGDNQVLKFIRQVKNISFDKECVDILYSERNKVKQQKSSKANSKKIVEIQNQIDELLFVPDLISIKSDTTKKDYKQICKYGFEVNIKINNTTYKYHYKRLCAGAGQLRRNTSLFVNEQIQYDLEQIMMCGLTKNRIGKINLAKFSAYYALYTSATNQVTTPRICVVNDFEYTLKNQDVSWIYDNDNGEKDIEHRKIDIEQNAFDGSGMISVEMAQIWQKDLDIEYLPSSFIIRSAWIKGLVSVFDFKRFGKEIAEKEIIVDAWGKEHNIKNIDVILTTSQFKMWKKYSSWDEYVYFHKKFKHIFGVARTNKKENNFLTPLNYQYIQSNNFSEESIKGLADFSIDWIKKLMVKDKLFTSLFLIGCQDEDSDIDKLENKMNSYIAKALLYDSEILNDDYVRTKINQMIEKKVRQLKIGKLFVEGSYDFVIPDLYAMAEHIFGLKINGLLQAKQSWNLRWVEKGSENVAMMRSPLVAPSENQLMNIYNDDKCKDWFRYIQSGMIVNIWDTAMMRASDADYDGDIVLTTDNVYMINSVRDYLYPITYEKKKSKEQRMNYNNFATMDTKSFNSKIGFITNLASNFIAMLSNFDKDSEEYKELEKRINLLRFFQGSAIDSTKGDVFIPPPRHWSKKTRYKHIDENLSEEEKTRIQEENKKTQFNNRICCNKKAYFFGYIYPSYMKDYKKHISGYNQLSMNKFVIPLDKLKKKPEKEKSDEEKYLLKMYYRYMPLLNNGCTMNVLSRYIESIEFENMWKNKNDFNWKTLLSCKEFSPNKSMLEKINLTIRKFNHHYQSILKNKSEFETYEMDNNMEFKFLYESFEQKLFEICSNEEVLLDHVIYSYYTYFKTYTKSLLWNVFGEQLVKNIKRKSTFFTIPVKDVNGVEYLGGKYSLLEIKI